MGIVSFLFFLTNFFPFLHFFLAFFLIFSFLTRSIGLYFFNEVDRPLLYNEVDRSFFLNVPFRLWFLLFFLIPVKFSQLQQLIRMAYTPLYGSHIIFAGEGPRSQQPHAKGLSLALLVWLLGPPTTTGMYYILRYSMQKALPGV